MSTIYDDLPFGTHLSTPRDLQTRRLRHILLAFICTMIAAATWFVPLGIPATAKPFIVVVIGFLPFAGIFIFRYAFFTCLLFVGFAFFRFQDVYPPIRPFRLPLLLSLAVLGVLCYNLFLSKKLRAYWEPVLTPFAMFAVWGIIGMFFGTNFAVSKVFFQDTYSKILIMTFVIAWMVRKPEQFLLAVKFIVISGIIVGTVAIYNKIMGIGLVEGTRVTIGRNLRSPLGDPNDLSLRLLFPMSFAVSLIMVPRSYWLKLLGASGTVIMIWAIIATQSRGGLLGLLTVMGVVGQRYIKSKVVLGSLGGVASVGLAVMAGLSDRKSGGSHEEGVDASAQARLDTWDTAWNMATSNPIFGVGYNNFYQNYFFYATKGDGKAHVVHSTWFGVMAENGFISFSLFIITIFLMAYTLLKMAKLLTYRRAPESVRIANLAVLAGLAGFCVSGTFLTQAFAWSIYILIALCAALSRFAREFKVETQERADDGYYDRPPPPEINLISDAAYQWDIGKTKIANARWDPDKDIGLKSRGKR